ncbi:hypothetical protein [Bacillus sp. T3]|uniref:MotE family protein n=1 Tax=Bacillus sp. T3 TaxID=467262 RepID=UPI002982A401|nr:hypothetical protein [Bacillus sp. T3]
MDERKRRKLESLFYIVIIPLIFTSIFGLIFINVLDIPVWKSFKEWGNRVPIVMNIVPGVNSAKPNSGYSIVSDNAKAPEKELNEKNEKIIELKQQISANKKSIEKLKQSNEELQQQVKVTQSKEFQKQIKKVAEIYSDIQPSKAAAMLVTMPIEEATLTIAMLNPNQQSSILGSMKDPKRAAEITMILKEIVVLKETDQVSLQTKIREIALKNESPTKTFAQAISGMQPVQVAAILQSMMAVNSQVTIDVIKDLPTVNRTSILAELAKVDGEMAQQITSNLN